MTIRIAKTCRSILALFMALSAATLLVGHARAGNSARCSLMRDEDRRAECRALAEGESSYCASIGDGDLRAFCRAQVERDGSYCGIIGDEDLRERCRAVSGG